MVAPAPSHSCPPPPSGATTSPTMTRDQLPLPFPHQPSYAAADFLAAPSNEAALAWLDRTDDWPDHRLALWGGAGCGKTHLLSLWAGRRGARLLAGADLRGLPDLPAPAGLALDDAGTPPDEPALLHLLNAVRETHTPVLLATRTPPARWPVKLPDLASRLRSVTAVEILPPEELAAARPAPAAAIGPAACRRRGLTGLAAAAPATLTRRPARCGCAAGPDGAGCRRRCHPHHRRRRPGGDGCERPGLITSPSPGAQSAARIAA